MDFKKLIEEHRHETNTWYIDMKDEQGNWLSGNILPQDQFGFGGFHSYDEVIGMCKMINKDSCFGGFYPQEVYIGYAPLNYDENSLGLFKIILR